MKDETEFFKELKFRWDEHDRLISILKTCDESLTKVVKKTTTHGDQVEIEVLWGAVQETIEYLKKKAPNPDSSAMWRLFNTYP